MLLNPAQLSAQDLQALDILIQAAFKHDGGLPAIYHHLLVLHREPPSHFLYFDSPDKLIGYLSIYFFTDQEAEISLLVHPDYRRQGVAKKLYQAAYPLLRSEHINTLLFSAPPRGASWLKKRGLRLIYSEHNLIREALTPEKISKSKLHIRETTLDDIPILCEIDKQCFKSKDPDMADRFRTLFSSQLYLVLVATYQNQVIGKVHLRTDPDQSNLTDLAIMPAFQKQGLGSELLCHAINIGLQNNMLPITLEVETSRQSLLKLYTQHGFTEYRKIDFWRKDNLDNCFLFL